VRPDEAAVIVVGDGAAVVDQIQPYIEEIETYTIAGKRKQTSTSAPPVNVVGSWTIELDTPLGQAIPALVTITREPSGFTAKITSEMGDADLGQIELNNNSFKKTAAIDMDGHSIEIQVAAQFDHEQVEGTLTMQNASMPFTGSRS